MMTAVLALLCLYLVTCYAYGGYLLVGVLRREKARAEEPTEAAVGPRAGILHAAPEPDAAEPAPTRAAA